MRETTKEKYLGGMERKKKRLNYWGTRIAQDQESINTNASGTVHNTVFEHMNLRCIRRYSCLTDRTKELTLW